MGVVMTALRWMSNLLPLAVGHILDVDAGGVVAELAFGKRVDGDASLSCPVVSLGDGFSTLLTKMFTGYK